MISLSHEPKISGLLNNCGLHCLVPSIIKTLESLSNASDAEHNNFPHIDHYRRLLTTFQTYYELEHKPSFSELYNFLKSYHSLDQQLIMGSLLRTFVFEHTGISQNESQSQFNSLDAIRGSYPPIEDNILEKYILNPFGFKGRFFDLNQNNNYIIPFEISSSKPHLQTINIYCKNEHYELSANPPPPDFDNNALFNAFEGMFTSQFTLSYGTYMNTKIQGLKMHIKGIFNKTLEPNAPLSNTIQEQFDKLVPNVSFSNESSSDTKASGMIKPLNSDIKDSLTKPLNKSPRFNSNLLILMGILGVLATYILNNQYNPSSKFTR